MKDVTGFEEEALHTEVEETTEAAAEGAIDVSEANAVAAVMKWEEKIQVPSIPATLNINGVDLNLKQLRTEVNDVLKMKIDGLGDEKGYNEAVEKLKGLSKLRTSSDTWRNKIMAPVRKLTKDLKSVIDDAGKICSEGETHLKAIIKPIDDAILIARQKAEEAKDELAKTRTAELIAVGGVHDGVGTINFPLDPGLFVLSEDLRTLVDEAYLVTYYEAKRLFDDEQTRLQAIEDAKLKEQDLLKSQVEDLNAERTEFRKEQLEMKGYSFVEEKGFYNEIIVITEEQIRTLDAAAWKALLNPPVVEVPEVKEEAPTVKSAPSSSHAMNQNYNPFAGVSSGFDVEPEPVAELPVFDAAFFTEDEKEEPFQSFAEPEAPVEVEKVITRTLVFSESKPFVEFIVGNGFKMRIHPLEYDHLCRTEDGIGVGDGSVNEQLRFQLIKI